MPALRDALAKRGLAVLEAAPGAGKSTIVPLRLLDEQWLAGGRIVMLEPRRLAARATARRMAFLLGEKVGSTVGYRTRDESRVSRSTRIEVVTEGILTRRLQNDPLLDGTGLVIFDEVHERNLHSDLALALSLDVRRGLRPDLALLTMSATLDATRLATLLGGADPAPIITSTGRAHRVDVRWIPPPANRRMAEATAGAVLAALGRDQGDLLVFLAGAGEIRRVATLLADDRSLPPDVDVRPLFGALSIEQQASALEPSPSGRRRVVLSTDIAETSLTVEGVRVVIDAGEVRRPTFDQRSGLSRLRTGPNSQASADQRSGRAGRTEPGVAYRLWSENEHRARPAFAEPEILGADLTSLALELAIWGASETDLSFLDLPPKRRLDDARELLERLGALDASGRPTEAGRAMARLPLHPRLAHMVSGSSTEGRGWLACVLAALLEDRDVLKGPASALDADLEERIRLVDDPARFHAMSDSRAIATVRRRATELARRARVSPGDLESSECGRVLALAYPDRIAQALGGGRFRLRNGQRVSSRDGDALGSEAFLVVAEVGPGPRAMVGFEAVPEDRIRRAAAIDGEDVEAVGADDIESVSRLVWNADRDDLELRTERRLGAIILASTTGRAVGSDETTAALVARAIETRLDLLAWSSSARAVQQRTAFARRVLGELWPDLSDDALIASVDEWLAPLLHGANCRSDLERVDIGSVLRSRLGHRLVRELDAIAPVTTMVPSGRSVRVDYDTDPPSISVRAQEMFGSAVHPTIAAGRLALAVRLLSPAGRVVQITSDLPGFWSGSWAAVRKEMAGRYPRHRWPVDPPTSEP